VRITKISESDLPSRRILWWLLLGLLLLSFAMVFIPVWLIQPFKPQTPRGVALSHSLKTISPWVTFTALALALFIAGKLWRGPRRWLKRALLVVILIPMLAATWFAHQNHFEWMFHPLANASYTKANDAAFVGEDDLVLAVNINGEAAAYPVRLMAYHHLVQDVVGGTPIVATY
jgi:hypothetical protein